VLDAAKRRTATKPVPQKGAEDSKEPPRLPTATG